jgi:predicted dehydrogenase
VIATPVSTHGPLARRCLATGRHVLVEKPLASTPEDAAELVTMAEQAGLTLMVGHTFLFSPRVERLTQFLRDGALGHVQYVTSSRLNLGIHQQDVGVIWDLAPHDFSILFHLLQEFPTTIQTAGRAVVHPGTLDVAFMNLTFASGIVASIDVSWLSPRKVRNTVVVGDQRMLIYDDMDSEEPVKVYDKGVVRPDPENFGEHQLTYRYGDVLVPHVAAKEPLAQEIRHFVDCVEGGATCRSPGRFGLGVVEALDAAERSWRMGGAPAAVERLLGEQAAKDGTPLVTGRVLESTV